MKYNLNDALDAALGVVKEKDEDIMEFEQIKGIHIYGTFQARPVVAGEEVGLFDYPKQTEAAWAVNAVHELLGTTPPNALHPTRLPTPERQAEIRKALREELIQRKLWSPKEEAVVEQVRAEEDTAGEGTGKASRRRK